MFLLALNTGCATVQDVDFTSSSNVDRPWAADDYKQLDKLIGAGQFPLPTLSDPASKAVFERMVSYENTAFTVVKDESVTADRRLLAVTETMSGVRLLLARYLSELQKGVKHEREMAKLLIYILDLGGLAHGLTEETLKLFKKDSAYQTRLDGLKQARLGLSQMYSGVVLSFTDRTVYSKTSRLEMIEALRKNTPKYGVALDSMTRLKALGTTILMLSRTNDPEEKEALIALRAAIKKI